MRRRPRAWYPEGNPGSLASPPGPKPPTTPTSAGNVIEPFIADGGGMTFYPTGYNPELPIEVAPDAVQLVCEQYVPPGRVAFLKRIEIAPCVPPILADPWRGWPGHFNFFEAGPDPFGSVQRAAAQAGQWETPMAWEGYVSAAQLALGLPFWRWALTISDGNNAYYRQQQNIPPFNPALVASWELALNFPVPRSPFYFGGAAQPRLPGRTLNGYIGPQRYPAPASNPLPCHFMVPENSTVMLWAYWRQTPIDPLLAFGPNGPTEPWDGAIGLPVIYPLLPSVGRMLGYMQAASREATQENAENGWGA